MINDYYDRIKVNIFLFFTIPYLFPCTYLPTHYKILKIVIKGTKKVKITYFIILFRLNVFCNIMGYGTMAVKLNIKSY